MDHHHLTHRYLLPVLLLLLLIAYRARPEVEDVSVTASDEEEKTGPEASLVDRAIGITTAAFNSHWDTIRTWANNLSWTSLQPPVSDLSWLESMLARSGSSPGEAAKSSFEANKETMVGAAKSAADAAGEAVEETKEKMKSTVSTPSEEETNAEL